MKHILVIALVLSLPLAAQVEVDPSRILFTGPFGKGGTWNLYESIRNSVTWTEAQKQAVEMEDPLGGTGKKAHLVSIHSLAENRFIYANAGAPELWIGLTDNERFGGKEAKTFPDRGWVWTSGEPVTFQFWARSQPDEWLNKGPGEDAVHFHWGSWWFDAGSGADGQDPRGLYYVVEWETQADKPIPGAVAYQPVWTKDYKFGKTVPGKWSVRWTYGTIEDERGANRRPRSIAEATPLLKAAFQPEGGEALKGIRSQTKRSFESDSPVFYFNTTDQNRQAMFPRAAAPKSELSTYSGPLIASIVGTIEVQEAGRYTFAIGAEDAFALRVGGKQWHAVHGHADLDPFDKTVLTQPYGQFSPSARGVIDLPAGQHLVEALWLTQSSGAELQISSAKGEFVNEGDTDQWRLLGHKAKDQVPWPGISEEGWTVECTKSKGHAAAGAKLLTLQDGLIAIRLGKNNLVEKGVKQINYGESGGERFTRYPDPKPFPNDVKDSAEDIFAMRASGKLVIPADGTYWLGIHADERGALRIKGHDWDQIIQRAQPGDSIKLNGDTISFHAWNLIYDARAVGEITLKKGTYEIEAMQIEDTGGGGFAVFGAPAGYPPRLLGAGGAEVAKDHDGLQLLGQN